MEKLCILPLMVVLSDQTFVRAFTSSIFQGVSIITTKSSNLGWGLFGCIFTNTHFEKGIQVLLPINWPEVKMTQKYSALGLAWQ